MTYRIISTIALAIVIIVLSLALFFDDGKNGKNPVRPFLFYIIVVQIMALGHVWR